MKGTDLVGRMLLWSFSIFIPLLIKDDSLFYCNFNYKWSHFEDEPKEHLSNAIQEIKLVAHA